MQHRDKILAKALKLRELSIRGIDGEKENAKTFLEAHMVKHNITDQELIQAGEKTTQAYKFYDQYFTDEKMFEEFLKEFFGNSGLIAFKLLKGYLSITNKMPNMNFKYKKQESQNGSE
jgi:hypothetical protein